ncbi:MAG TPA: response regulator [Caldimonas sp.]|nr:response regulator [Caldimonas sp.]
MVSNSATSGPAATPRILVVAEGSEAAQAIAERLDADLASGVHLSIDPARAAADLAETRAEVVLLGLPTLAASKDRARMLRPGGTPELPIVVALCAKSELAAAARLVREGVLDDYLPLAFDPADPDRLATSVRTACRLAPPAVPRMARRERPIVLLVEDDEFSHQLVAITLQSRNVELVFESEGDAALERIRRVRPDLVLMDVNLPGRDGVELTQRLKADPALAAIPVVMLTGEARREILVRSMEAGAADFIVKPFTPDALIAKLARFLPALH